MNLKKISLATIIILMAFVFSACEEDYWERQTLVYHSYDSPRPPITDDRGFVSIVQPVYIADISGQRDFRRIRMYYSSLLLESNGFRSRDRIYVKLSTSRNSRVFSGEMVPTQKRDQFIIDVDINTGYALFIEDLFLDLERYGDLRLYIDVDTGIKQNGGIQIDYEFFNNLDIETR